MGEVTESQKGRIVTGLEECAEMLGSIKESIDGKDKLERLGLGDYGELLNKLNAVIKKAKKIAQCMHDCQSDEPPFNMFKESLQFANHAMPIAEFQLTIGVIESGKKKFFGGGRKNECAEIDEDRYNTGLMACEYALNSLRIFKKIVSEEYVTQKFKIREVLEPAMAYRKHKYHHDKYKLINKVENWRIRFDRDALYWIVMRMLSNAERATDGVTNACIKMETLEQNGNYYLVISNNGRSMEELKVLSEKRKGGKSLPNINKICDSLGSEFILEKFSKGTRAYLRLPRA